MQWFKHDTNSTMDFKIKKLLIRYGAVGYAIYFHCLELIASSIGENNITFELEHDAEIIADDLRITGTTEKSGREMVEEIMRYMIDLNLFEESNGHIFCFKLLRRLDSSMTSNPRVRNMIAEAKKKQIEIESHDEVMTGSCCSHDDVMTGSCCSHDEVMLDKIRIEEIRRDKNRLDEINSADKSAAEETTEKKKKTNPYKDIFTIYEKNFVTLYEQGRVSNDKPEVNYSQCGKLIKNLISKGWTESHVIQAIDKALMDKWIVDNGYSLATILSSNQFNKLINSRGGTSEKYNPHNEVHTDEEYRRGADDPDTIPY